MILYISMDSKLNRILLLADVLEYLKSVGMTYHAIYCIIRTEIETFGFNCVCLALVVGRFNIFRKSSDALV